MNKDSTKIATFALQYYINSFMPTKTLLKDRLEFITVAAQLTLFLEKATEEENRQFAPQLSKLLATLYLKTSLLSFSGDEWEEDPERVVSEIDYERIRAAVADRLGEYDDYLTVFHPEMQYSDTPIAVTISEDIADIYQELKDFLYNCSLGDEEVMHNALLFCLSAFRSHWGRKLLNALSALHSVIYN